MTVSGLIAEPSRCPADARVTLPDPDNWWLMPIEIACLPADGCNREVDFIAITAPRAMRSKVWPMDSLRRSLRYIRQWDADRHRKWADDRYCVCCPFIPVGFRTTVLPSFYLQTSC